MTTKFEAGDEVLIRGVLVESQDLNYPLSFKMNDGLNLGTFSEEGFSYKQTGKQVLELVKKGKLPFGQVRSHREEASKYQAFVFQDTGENVFYKIMYLESGKEMSVVREKMDFLKTYPKIVDQQK